MSEEVRTPGSTEKRIINALTIDVEDYFQVHAFSNAIRPEDWESYEPRVRENTLLILDMIELCSEIKAKVDGNNDWKHSATFFVLGWVAERFPDLVKEIAARGHEIASHGYSHKCIYNQTRKEFEEDVRKAKSILENITGKAIQGYRAPTYSIRKDTLWAIEVLISEGFVYDSSIFPIKHDNYGLAEAPRFPFFIYVDKEKVNFQKMEQVSLGERRRNSGRRLLEVPLTTTRLLGANMPIAGGGYFRALPYRLTKTFLKKVNNREKKPFIFYVHPWELDKSAPKMSGGNLLSSLRTYLNLKKTEERLARLLSEFRFSSVSQLLENIKENGSYDRFGS